MFCQHTWHETTPQQQTQDGLNTHLTIISMYTYQCTIYEAQSSCGWSKGGVDDALQSLMD